MWGSEMRDYEYMYRALVRRLVEIADCESREEEHDMDRVTFYDRVARAHEMTVQTWKEMEEDNVS